jgi:nitrous oxidase accessory protein
MLRAHPARASRPIRQVVAALAAAVGAMNVPAGAGAQATLVVGQGGRYRSVTAAVAAARPGDRVLVRAATWREPTIVIRVPLTLEGEPGAVLDGGGTHGVVLVLADDVTIRGLVVRSTGSSQLDDRAGIRVREARNCRITGNRVEQTLFGIFLEKAAHCLVADNVVRGEPASQGATGNAIQAWQSDTIELARNDVRGHRDGIYFEFVRHALVHGNTSAGNQRYGLHFMFSDDCRYDDNRFVANGNGVAVMYSHRVQLTNNRFERNWGSAAYGLLLKEISDGMVRGNRFTGNSIALYLEDANRNEVAGNVFDGNGWAVRLLANAQDNTFTGNRFEANTFDVTTNSRTSFSTFDGNFWDRYRGYDLDHDNVGDVPFAPVRLFSLAVEQTPALLVLLRSPLVGVLDLAERVLPSLTPEMLVDRRPLMHAPGGGR